MFPIISFQPALFDQTHRKVIQTENGTAQEFNRLIYINPLVTQNMPPIWSVRKVKKLSS